MEQLENSDVEGMLLSIDYEKCFDRIEWSAIQGALKLFNFGQNLCKWVHTLSNGTNVQILNNGLLTEKIRITRGCCQGSPASPYYFLLCAELLATQLRKNEQIEGFDICSFCKLFGQYADDMDIYCKTTQNNIDQIHQILSAFCENTGCKVNYEKTTLYRIGRDNNAIANVYTRGMRIETNSINILGIDIHRDTTEMMSLNYQGLIYKIKGILKNWERRSLDLLAKIAIINSLITSLFVYKMSVLPNMPNVFIVQYNNVIEKFLWNGRRPKISLAKLQLPKKAGGAGLVDITVKEAALKESWIPYVESEWDKFISEIAYKNLHPLLREHIWQCNWQSADIEKELGADTFWKQVLIAWSHINYRHKCQKNQPLWLNSLLRVGHKTLFWKKPFRKGLWNTLQAILTKVKWDIEETPLIDSICKIVQPVKWYYNTHKIKDEALLDVYVCWSVRFQLTLSYVQFIQLFSEMRKITNSSKLRSFQFRLLHLSIVTNVQLKKWKILDSDICTFCKNYSETLEHLFFHCENAQ